MIYEYLRENNKKIIEKDNRSFSIKYTINWLEHFNKRFHSEIEGYRILLLNIYPYIGIKLRV